MWPLQVLFDSVSAMGIGDMLNKAKKKTQILVGRVPSSIERDYHVSFLPQLHGESEMC